MGLIARIGKLLEFTRTTSGDAKASEARYNVGGPEVKSGKHFAPAGDDAYPLAGDYLVSIQSPTTGVELVVGYLDPQAPQSSSAGDKRIYGRSSAGAEVNSVWLKNTGDIVITNGTVTITYAANGTITETNGNYTRTVATAGDVTETAGSTTVTKTAAGAMTITAPEGVTINGAKFDSSGVLTADEAVINGVTQSEHKHDQANDSAGNTEERTGVPVND